MFAMFFKYFKGKFLLIDCPPKLTCICISIFGLSIDTVWQVPSFFYPNGGVPGNSVEHSSRCSQVQAEQQEAMRGKHLETGHWKFD